MERLKQARAPKKIKAASNLLAVRFLREKKSKLLMINPCRAPIKMITLKKSVSIGGSLALLI
jgi:hypothetical protein